MVAIYSTGRDKTDGSEVLPGRGPVRRGRVGVGTGLQEKAGNYTWGLERPGEARFQSLFCRFLASGLGSNLGDVE